MQENDQYKLYDLAIIGGGINGVGIARDAAGRGLKVLLCEQRDLASGTSSYSSKLIHGGLRYLEHYEFRLVKEALDEREKLLKIAPHIIQPLEVILPHNNLLRPAWMIRLGLFLYDHLAKRESLPSSKGIKLHHHLAGVPLKEGLSKGFSYADCLVDDARLVILNALSAKELGATILTHHRCTAVAYTKQQWRITLLNTHTQEQNCYTAKAIVNATGPWLNETLKFFKTPTQHHINLVKGSHIVVSKLYQGEHAYLLQQNDNRVVFVIPFCENYHLIGTTDVAFENDPSIAKITDEEKQYLCKSVNKYFKKAISEKDIVWDFAGVRPLIEESAEQLSHISRDYKLELISAADSPPVLHIFGGKLTTYRRLAEQSLALLNPYFKQMKSPWTATVPLPGGEFQGGSILEFKDRIQQQFPWLPVDLRKRLLKNYGSRMLNILACCYSLDDLGQDFGCHLYGKEIDYLLQHEWATSTDDILWRRTKLGLTFSNSQIQQLQNYIADKKS